MKSSELLKAAEEKVNNTLVVYTKRNRCDPELHERLIEELKRATNEFLEARRQNLSGLGHA